MFTFLDALEPLELPWAQWNELAATSPRFVAQLSGPDVNGHDAPVRVGALFVADARTVCGLRLWDDAAEGVEGSTPWAAFEVEKLARMMLHQSGVAFELLASPRAWSADVDGRHVVQAAATRNITGYYEEVAAGLLGGPFATELWRWRSLLTGLLLARAGEVSFHLDTLLDRLHEPDLEPLRERCIPAVTVATAFHAELASSPPPLPENPTDYPWLDEWVARLRLDA